MTTETRRMAVLDVLVEHGAAGGTLSELEARYAAYDGLPDMSREAMRNDLFALERDGKAIRRGKRIEQNSAGQQISSVVWIAAEAM